MENFDILSAMSYFQQIMEKEDKSEVLNLLREKLGDDIPLTEDDLRGPMSKDKMLIIAKSIRPKLPVPQQYQLDLILEMFFK